MEIRYLAYIGPKPEKRINAPCGKVVVFPREEVVDVSRSKIDQRRLKELLRTGLFKLYGEESAPLELGVPEPEQKEVNPLECDRCGFIAASTSGLKTHQRFCKK